MSTFVVPFVGREGKTRLHPSPEIRAAFAVAMCEDVLAACRAVGPTILAGLGGGQGAAVAAALAEVDGPVAIVNADLPCVTPADLLALAEAAPALVAAADGTTNAVSFRSAADFQPLYGPGSAVRFAALAKPVAIPNLADDVDTVDDLERLEHRVGPHTRAAFTALRGSLA